MRKEGEWGFAYMLYKRPLSFMVTNRIYRNRTQRGFFILFSSYSRVKSRNYLLDFLSP